MQKYCRTPCSAFCIISGNPFANAVLAVIPKIIFVVINVRTLKRIDYVLLGLY